MRLLCVKAGLGTAGLITAVSRCAAEKLLLQGSGPVKDHFFGVGLPSAQWF